MFRSVSAAEKPPHSTTVVNTFSCLISKSPTWPSQNLRVAIGFTRDTQEEWAEEVMVQPQQETSLIKQRYQRKFDGYKT